ncbi:PREDICTED: uncharacterized protein LOC104804971 isoform X2 [Tarenaya hassleriana]|uniref:uncharacterized protein LOC104804971 isoform X1 n=1 Tax=Tarenaya hassleriana TaxID=28532 RepID=UPI00053C0D2C|nr:PREDICTED: uncharacterized protein LOC104804971 isoform X1 [Tarenaya hassleriana]XP_010527662.1 PREDICTED: uncharacterized protein LOC104804971 isoform X2 [Tarenaya hassleriana]
MEGPGLEPDSESESDPFPFPLPSSVNLAPFSPVPPPSARRLSSHFTRPHRPVESAHRRKLAYISLHGVLVNADEASSSRSIGGGLSSEVAVAWELFTPIQRFLIVAVVGVAVAESKKNRAIRKLQKSVDLRDQLLSDMQQKLDDLCEQLNLIKHHSGTGPKASDDDNLQRTLKETFGSQNIKFIDCGCWLCDQHHHLLPSSWDKPLSKASTGYEMHNETTNLVNDTEPEERRMSDLSDWGSSSVTSAAEIHFNNLSLNEDMLYLRKECQEKDATIKELATSLQSSNKAGSKRVSELEDIIRRKNTIITRLKKDMLVLEQKVTQLTRLQRSSSAATRNSRDLPIMRENLLYDMDVSTSASSSDSETPVTSPHLTTPKIPIDPIEEVHSNLEQSHKSMSAKCPASLVNSVKTPSVSPLQEVSTNQKLVSVSSSSRLRRASSSEAPKKLTRAVQITSRDSSGSRKRWI